VIIVGVGPVGLLTALRLGQAGISTLVLESHHTLLPTTRAVVYMPVVIPVLKNAFLNREGVTWRDSDGNALAHLPLSSSSPGEFGGVLLFGQSRMNALILEELKKYPTVEVRFGLRCVGIEDLPSTGKVKVMVHQRNLVDEDLMFEADYVLASDGASGLC
jgi:2-polyprenyl-6-methoxyphenol hydroxylase-like FAD-dependent oxidoreductase